ncbi:SMI1/KNR4 family protein [Crocosphaera chwakensis]|uniref:Knr4/Smi1-like domain-containing protein n=1 Tax=Crocosphaera chwakensis CCY0110 TaxID=391612 RepID=A3IWV7_9CHRO|nr:hypothetical protein CY0110_01410 [Crocosphaera chwakensis CCY0110]
MSLPASETELIKAYKRGVPKELLELYKLGNGMFIGYDSYSDASESHNFRLEIPELSKIQTVQSYGFVCEDAPLYNLTEKWWQFVDNGNGNWLAFDGNQEGYGRILDIFHEEVGYEECHGIIAESITELLDQLVQRDGTDWFGNEEWQPLGYV